MALNSEQAKAAARKRWKALPLVRCSVCGKIHRCQAGAFGAPPESKNVPTTPREREMARNRARRKESGQVTAAEPVRATVVSKKRIAARCIRHGVSGCRATAVCAAQTAFKITEEP